VPAGVLALAGVAGETVTGAAVEAVGCVSAGAVPLAALVSAAGLGGCSVEADMFRY